jgi:transcriptional regulator with XRE-family HTH domain
MGLNGNFGRNPGMGLGDEGELEKTLRRDLGQRIVRLRDKRGLSQVELAKELGIDRSRLGKWERGLHAPLLRQLTMLGRTLGVSLDELITGRPPGPEHGSGLGLVARDTLTDVVGALNQLLQPKKPDPGGSK